MELKHNRDAGDVVERSSGRKPSPIVVPSAAEVDRLNNVDPHGLPNLQESERESLRSRQGVLSLPCGASIVVDGDGRVLGGGATSRRSWFTYTRSLEDAIRSLGGTLERVCGAVKVIARQTWEPSKSRAMALSTIAGSECKIRGLLKALADHRADLGGDSLYPQVRREGAEDAGPATPAPVGASDQGAGVGNGTLPVSPSMTEGDAQYQGE